jgi:2,3-bisphosphoglycerate-dependent phosphoglycerate mutase
MLELRPRLPFERPLWFMRHGATKPNLEGLRCGGDLDVPLTPIGREQVLVAAQHLSAQDLKLHAVVCSPLKRTVESAQIVARVLGGTPIDIEEGFRERLLGSWNMQPVEDTEDAMRAGVTPPGGEPSRDFGQRVLAALRRTAQRHGSRRVLVLGSKGVARVLRETLPEASPAAMHAAARNAELMLFDLGALEPAHALETVTI